MRLNSLHTIWSTLFTTLMLLVSSVTNSAPLMNIQMMSTAIAHHSTMTTTSKHNGMSNMMTHTITEASLPTNINKLGTSANCDGGSGILHTCCTAACTFVYVPLPTPVNLPIPVVYRAGVTADVTHPTIQVKNDLYRPPIA
ncbi:hypothetical protein [Vibrio sp. AND4]|uniref:hypothetical protein n=1 Tax=Vibrio sp. AND4 TaxID=314289 RepID=UPI00015F341E|nr:hypothetical protein [Vibrio sp. AND4]EDP59519.1 hypothetical protein AND4_10194 [Vibrio sp. AND4]